MADPAWKDVTGYGHGERGTAEPRAWELDLAGLRVTVHRLHGLPGWYGTCHAMGVKDANLCANNATDAQPEFLGYLHKRSLRWAEKLAAALGAKGGGA